MRDFFNRFRIPTLLGLGIIFVGIAAGVYATLREQTFLSQAAPSFTPQDVVFTNISDSSVVVSFQTNTSTTAFVTYGQNSPSDQTVLDDRDNNVPKARSNHYFTLKDLLPKTNYQLKIFSGKITSNIFKFITAAPSQNQSGFTPVIGSVLDEDKPLSEGIAYLAISGAITQSATILPSGNFLIPLSQIRKDDLSDNFLLTEGTLAKLTIISDKGQAVVAFKLNSQSKPLPPFKIGQTIDLVAEETAQLNPTSSDLSKFDLNLDGKINAADNAIVLQNFGKNPQNKKADLNGDGVVDQKDLDLMSQKIKELGTQ